MFSNVQYMQGSIPKMHLLNIHALNSYIYSDFFYIIFNWTVAKDFLVLNLFIRLLEKLYDGTG